MTPTRPASEVVRDRPVHRATPGRAVRELTLDRGDVRLAVTDTGGDGPPVVLLHGLAGSARELLPTAAALADRHRVVLLDQRGHGGSTRRPADVSREAFVADVVEVLERLLPGERVRLVGQSMGAAVLREFLDAWPPPAPERPNPGRAPAPVRAPGVRDVGCDRGH